MFGDNKSTLLMSHWESPISHRHMNHASSRSQLRLWVVLDQLRVHLSLSLRRSGSSALGRTGNSSLPERTDTDASKSSRPAVTWSAVWARELFADSIANIIYLTWFLIHLDEYPSPTSWVISARSTEEAWAWRCSNNRTVAITPGKSTGTGIGVFQ